MQRQYQVIDVFATTPLTGNPLALVVDADGLAAPEMQRLAAWTNLSETAFLLPPTTSEADYRVRIFTPSRELPFAGHPTLGSCRGWLEAGGTPHQEGVVVQECGAGLVPIQITGETLAFAAPPLVRDEDVDDDDLARAAAAMNLAPGDVVDARWADNGPGWLVLLLASAEAVLDVEPVTRSETPFDIGLVGPYPAGSDHELEVRALFTLDGVVREDPVTGSLNAAVAQWLLGSDRITAPYVAGQGQRVGSDGRVLVSVGGGQIWIGGQAEVMVSGHLGLG